MKEENDKCVWPLIGIRICLMSISEKGLIEFCNNMPTDHNFSFVVCHSRVSRNTFNSL